LRRGCLSCALELAKTGLAASCGSRAVLDEIAVIRFCETRMPYFAVPRFLEFAAALPATENGKIQKYKLRERGYRPHLGPPQDHHKAKVVCEMLISLSVTTGSQ
jgi:acyl-CoA synthetase (AMP-forming)/AMP-acid ligase II